MGITTQIGPQTKVRKYKNKIYLRTKSIFYFIFKNILTSPLILNNSTQQIGFKYLITIKTTILKNYLHYISNIVNRTLNLFLPDSHFSLKINSKQ